MPPSRISFTEGNHAYWYRTDAGRKERVRSVTTLLGVLAKPALVKWAARTAAEYAVDNWSALIPLSPSERVKQIANAPEQRKTAAGAKGTAIHGWAEELIAGRPVEIPEEYTETVKRFADWWVASGFTAEQSEIIVWSDDDDLAGARYAGRFDCLALHPRHGWTLIDWKTGASGVWPEHGVQLAGYAAADWRVTHEQDYSMQRVDTLAAVHIRPDGSTLHVLTDDQRRVAEHRWSLVRSLWAVGEPEFTEVIS